MDEEQRRRQRDVERTCPDSLTVETVDKEDAINERAREASMEGGVAFVLLCHYEPRHRLCRGCRHPCRRHHHVLLLRRFPAATLPVGHGKED